MAVDDAELLALAGGDSSDDEDTPQQTTINRNANSPLPSIEISQPSNSRPAASKPRPSPPSKMRGSSNQAKNTGKHDSEEEGEA